MEEVQSVRGLRLSETNVGADAEEGGWERSVQLHHIQPGLGCITLEKDASLQMEKYWGLFINKYLFSATLCPASQSESEKTCDNLC